MRIANFLWSFNMNECKFVVPIPFYWSARGDFRYEILKLNHLDTDDSLQNRFSLKRLWMRRGESRRDLLRAQEIAFYTGATETFKRWSSSSISWTFQSFRFLSVSGASTPATNYFYHYCSGTSLNPGGRKFRDSRGKIVVARNDIRASIKPRHWEKEKKRWRVLVFYSPSASIDFFLSFHQLLVTGLWFPADPYMRPGFLRFLSCFFHFRVLSMPSRVPPHAISKSISTFTNFTNSIESQ